MRGIRKLPVVVKIAGFTVGFIACFELLMMDPIKRVSMPI